MLSKLDYRRICDFRTSGQRVEQRRFLHPTGVRFTLKGSLNSDGNVEVSLDDIVSTDHQLKWVGITFKHISMANGVRTFGPRFAKAVKTDFRFDGKEELLIVITKEMGELYFRLHFIAEVEEKGLQADLKQLLKMNPDNPLFADVILECEGVELKCHSFILAARSPVFRAALTQASFLEQQTRKIKIEDMDLDILRQVIRFIYSDTVDIGVEEDRIPALFHAADRYDIQKLCTLCLGRMVEHVDVSSAAKLFRLAHVHNHVELRKKAAEIIHQNFDEVRASADWSFVKSDPQLLEKLLMDSFSNKRKHNDSGNFSNSSAATVPDVDD